MQDALLSYLAAGKDPVHVQNLQADFAQRLAMMLGDAPGGVSIYSGYRSVERQAQLWEEALAKYRDPEIADNWVARPGQSKHNFGKAADLDYANDEIKAWVHQNAANYGLAFPMGHEPWHIELASDGQGGVMPVMVADNAPVPADAAALAPPAPRSLGEMLASSMARPSRQAGPAPRAQAPEVQTGNVMATVNPVAAGLLQELQEAASRPAMSRRLPTNLG